MKINSIFEINARLNLMNIIPFYLMSPFSRTDIKYCSFHFTKANEEKNALQKKVLKTRNTGYQLVLIADKTG